MKVDHPNSANAKMISLQQSQPNAENLIKGGRPERRVYKLVLTGGPCGGKTTGQSKLATFFESIGWKVFRVPETATVLMSGGIAFGELNQEQVLDFQYNLIKTMLTLEDTYFSMAEKWNSSGGQQNCLVICDRGTMDASAFISPEEWNALLERLELDEERICEGRYDHVVHMVSAANGAEEFYSVEEHAARFEGIELARDRDKKAMESWREHPYVDIVDNRKSRDFDGKLKHLIDVVVKRIGLDAEVGDRFKANSRKVKFCIRGPLPADDVFPAKFNDFEVVHHYLQTSCKGIQSRLRCRGKEGRYTYTCTVRRPEKAGQIVEVKSSLSKKEYENLLVHADPRHLPVYKTRRCFLFNNQQYQLDIYRDPCHPRCHGLILLETFTTELSSADVINRLPSFLKAYKDVTGDPAFSMYNLALKSEWVDSAFDFCHTLVAEEENEVRNVSSATKTNDDIEHKENLKCLSLSEGTSIQVKAIPDIELSSNRDSFDRQQQNDGLSGMHSSSESEKDDKMKTNNNIEYDEWDDELRLKRNQLDVLQAHNRFIQTKEEINRRNSGINLEAVVEQDKNIDQKNNNSSSDFSSVVSSNSNEKIKDH